MCGIVAYIGPNQAYNFLIQGLKRLEYRGYDSAGIALLDGDMKVYKEHGKVQDLENKIGNQNIEGTKGIGHTRWATHGEPNQKNAHPHLSQSGNLAVIHNGIIENYATLKEALVKTGGCKQRAQAMPIRLAKTARAKVTMGGKPNCSAISARAAARVLPTTTDQGCAKGLEGTA